MFNFSSSYALHQKKLLVEQAAARKHKHHKTKSPEITPKEVNTQNVLTLDRIKQASSTLSTQLQQQRPKTDITIIEEVVETATSPRMNKTTELEGKMNQMSQSLTVLAKKLEDETLDMNGLKDKDYKIQIQLKNMQDTLDKLQQQQFLLTENMQNIKVSAPTTAYGFAIQKVFLFNIDRSNLEIAEYIDAKEKVMLVYPTTLEQDGNIWIKVRRILDNGAVHERATVFFEKSSQTCMFHKFSL